MAPIITPVSAIVTGRINIRLHVRVAHIWTIPDFNRPKEDSLIHLLLLDEKLGKIQATAKKHLIPKIKSLVEEGAAYEVEKLLVTKNEIKYQTTQHKFRINLIDRTTFTKIDGVNIPMNHFEFLSFVEILESEREDKIIDIIGHVVEKDVMKDKELNGRTSKLLDLTLEDSEGIMIHCSLWGSYAEIMSSFIATHDANQPIVVLMQKCKTKSYCGAMGVSNAFYGTKLILDGDVAEMNQYKSKISGADVQVTQGVSQTTSLGVVSLVDDMLQSQRMTIEDLIEASDKCHGVVLAIVCDIEKEFGWYYQACTKCAGRVKTIAGRLFCPKCNTGRNAVPRFKVHLQVMDHTGSTSFIVFDRNVQSYVGKSVQDLIDSQQNNAADFPSDIDNFYGKNMLFKVEVADGNIIHNWRSYAVKRITDDQDVVQRFMVLHNIKSITDDDNDLNDDNVVALTLSVPNEVEVVDSSKSAVHQNETAVITLDEEDKADEQTPCSKIVGNRSAEKGVSDLTAFELNEKDKDDEETPCSKQVGKRSAEKVASELTAFELDGVESATKTVKLKCVKLEPQN